MCNPLQGWEVFMSKRNNNEIDDLQKVFSLSLLSMESIFFIGDQEHFWHRIHTGPGIKFDIEKICNKNELLYAHCGLIITGVTGNC